MLGWLKKKSTPVLSPQEGYDLWALSYAQESNPIKDLSNKFAESMLHELRGKSILDAGCGTGHFCLYAERQGAAHIIGVDFSPVMIEQAKKNCPATRFYCGDISTLNIEAPVDVIICALVIGHIENISTLFANFSDVLKPGGQLILTDFHPVLTMQNARRTFKNLKTDQVIEIKHYLHTLEEIKSLLGSAGFSIDQLQEPQWNKVPVVYGLKALKI
ncbi:MAG TPA: class I SAM-dependent methyltransferase [Cyclobacteriaceae bacterium]|nr:class I SAM-dependent methyltransferase [Cyclobacteriaceae bacterium]